MRIRPATVSDAASMAALVRADETVLVEDEGSASPFWESMSELAHAQNLASVRFRYWVAESEHLLLGFIAFATKPICSTSLSARGTNAKASPGSSGSSLFLSPRAPQQDEQSP